MQTDCGHPSGRLNYLAISLRTINAIIVAGANALMTTTMVSTTASIVLRLNDLGAQLLPDSYVLKKGLAMTHACRIYEEHNAPKGEKSRVRAC